MITTKAIVPETAGNRQAFLQFFAPTGFSRLDGRQARVVRSLAGRRSGACSVPAIPAWESLRGCITQADGGHIHYKYLINNYLWVSARAIGVPHDRAMQAAIQADCPEFLPRPVVSASSRRGYRPVERPSVLKKRMRRTPP
jgi:hypothetical protein